MAEGHTRKKGRGGIARAFLSMTILPMIVLGLVIIVSDYYFFTSSIQSEVKNGLRSVAQTVLVEYGQRYEGDYNLLVNDENPQENYLKKGDAVISEDFSFLDGIKEETGIDITIFFWDVRMLTTIKDAEGSRLIGTTVHQLVRRDVLESGGQECFFEKVRIGDRDYFTEYLPIYSSKGTLIGMIGAAKPSSEVFWLANHSIILNLMLIAAAILVVIIIMSVFASSLVTVLGKEEKFLGQIAEGNLDSRLDETILSRQDEIGDMGRFTIHVQASLKKLIERDALTGLYNRRSGQIRSKRQVEKGEPFSLAMGDIDFFKRVNDTYGHDAGDEVLRSVARLISDGLVGRGYAARWGGEEFLIIFENCDSLQAAETLEKILNRIRESIIKSGDFEIRVTMSYGVVTGCSNEPVEVQIKKADRGLYYAKEHGRNQVVNVDLLKEEELEDHPDDSIVILERKPAPEKLEIQDEADI